MSLTFQHPKKRGQVPVRILSFSGAGFPHGEICSYAQQGSITGFSLGPEYTSTFYTLDWHSGKQRRVAVSSGAAEIIAAHQAYYEGRDAAVAIKQITGRDVPIELIVDSKSL